MDSKHIFIVTTLGISYLDDNGDSAHNEATLVVKVKADEAEIVAERIDSIDLIDTHHDLIYHIAANMFDAIAVFAVTVEFMLTTTTNPENNFDHTFPGYPADATDFWPQATKV